MASSLLSTASASSAYVAPVWFISHGGPPTMFDATHAAYAQWRQFGQELLEEHDAGKKMKGIVAVSAHWESDRDGVIEVNTDPSNPLVYDYYGFPDHYYKVKVHSENPSHFSSLILQTLNESFTTDTCNPFLRSAQPTSRGIDHGVFVPLKVAFSSSTPRDPTHSLESSLPSSLPLCEITLPPPSSSQNTARASLLLGKALRKLRTEHQIGIFAGGMPVHNLRELGRYFDRSNGGFKTSKLAPYAQPFLDAISKTLNVDPAPFPSSSSREDANAEDPRWEKLSQLLKREDYKQAHPTDEHLMPLFVALGATFADERLHEGFKMPEGSLGWIQYRTANAAA